MGREQGVTQWDRVETARMAVKSLESLIVNLQAQPVMEQASVNDRRVLADALMGLMQTSVHLHTLLYTTDAGTAMKTVVAP